MKTTPAVKNQSITLLAVTLLAALTLGACQKEPQVAQVAVHANTTCTLAVEGMTCATCPAQVRTAIKRLPGIASVDVTLSPGRATVKFDGKLIKAPQLAAAPSGIGYPSKILACGKLKVGKTG